VTESPRFNSFRSARSLVKRTLRTLGYDIGRSPSVRWLQELGIKTVVDVGANTGQFAQVARQIFPQAIIHAFEPIEDCRASLEKRFANDRRFFAYPFALGTESGTVAFHRNAYTPSSSLLRMADLHKRNFPYATDERQTTIEIRRMDEALSKVQLQAPILVKLDVQGYEDKVILGGPQVLSAAAVVITEVSFEPLYVGQPLFDQIHEMLQALGFTYRGNWDQLRGLDGRVLQSDAIYMR
jgi:FkbM family methyltransferase